MTSTAPSKTDYDATEMATAQARVRELAASQIENYRRQPAELVGQYNREVSALDGYRGRQLLELLQNADDASVDATAGCTLLLGVGRSAV